MKFLFIATFIVTQSNYVNKPSLMLYLIKDDGQKLAPPVLPELKYMEYFNVVQILSLSFFFFFFTAS